MNHSQLGSQQGIPSPITQRSVNLPGGRAVFSKHTVRAQMWTEPGPISAALQHHTANCPAFLLSALGLLGNMHLQTARSLRSTSQVRTVSLAAR